MSVKRKRLMSNEELDSLLLDGNWREIERRRYEIRESQFKRVLVKAASQLGKKEYGHGVEKFEDVLHPDDADTSEKWALAILYHSLKNQFEKYHGRFRYNTLRPSSEYQPFAEAIRFAIQNIEDWGIEYTGWGDTFLYMHPHTKQWFQVDRETVEDESKAVERKFFAGEISETLVVVVNNGLEEEMLKERLLRLELPTPIIVRVDLDEKEPQLWKTAKSLRTHFALSNFEMYSPIWHALNILHFYHDGYHSAWKEVFQERHRGELGRKRLLFEMHLATSSAYEIGRSHESLIKKPIENDAIRGRKVFVGLQRAADQVSSIHSPLRETRLKMMARLVGDIGVDSAAYACEAEGLGNWQAIKRQWNRHKKKRDT